MINTGVCRECSIVFEYERLSNRAKTYCSETCRIKASNRREFEDRAYLSPTKIWLRDYKGSNPCTDCKQIFPWYVMEFDHIADNKYKKIAQISNQSLEKVLDEMAKCELVCVNCHRIRTYKRNHGLEWRVNI